MADAPPLIEVGRQPTRNKGGRNEGRPVVGSQAFVCQLLPVPALIPCSLTALAAQSTSIHWLIGEGAGNRDKGKGIEFFFGNQWMEPELDVDDRDVKDPIGSNPLAAKKKRFLKEKRMECDLVLEFQHVGYDIVVGTTTTPSQSPFPQSPLHSFQISVDWGKKKLMDEELSSLILCHVQFLHPSI